MYWSPDESLLTTLEECGSLKVSTKYNFILSYITPGCVPLIVSYGT